MTSDIDFVRCPDCGGYGVRDNGDNCRTCGGSGTGGLRSTDGMIGSGEIMVDQVTRRRLEPHEVAQRLREKIGHERPKGG